MVPFKLDRIFFLLISKSLFLLLMMYFNRQ